MLCQNCHTIKVIDMDRKDYQAKEKSEAVH